MCLPSIDAFAKTAVRFERAYASAPWTRPSVGSMITGLHPSSHGGIAGGSPAAGRGASPWPRSSRTTDTRLKGVVSNWVIAAKNGFAQGFEVYNEWAAALHQKSTSEVVTKSAKKMLDELTASGRTLSSCSSTTSTRTTATCRTPR